MPDASAGDRMPIAPELAKKLNSISNLPSPPGVACQLVEMSQDPAIGMPEVAAVVELDPAVTAKILKTANSPAFSRQGTVGSLTQAVTLLGLSETLSMALSFSLVNSLHSAKHDGLDYRLFWRRSLGVATFARVLARLGKRAELDRYFLCGLLQDIGMLVIDTGFPDVYAGTAAIQTDHGNLCSREQHKLGGDHAAVGAWLLRQWSFPEYFHYATACSHDRVAIAAPEEFRELIDYIHIAQVSGDLWWRRDWGDGARRGARLSESRLGIDRDTYLEALSVQSDLLRETASVFDIDLGDTSAMATVMKHAAEALETDALYGACEPAPIPQSPGKDNATTTEDRYDALTGLHNRAYLEHLQRVTFDAAMRTNTPLCLIAIDIDDYAGLSGQLGERVDHLVRLIGAALQKAIRKIDIAGRYENGRFLLYLPSTPLAGAEVFARRLLEIVRQLGASPTLVKLSLSISIGIAATVLPGIENGQSLCASAIAALDEAGNAGGDRLVIADSAATPTHDEDDALGFEIPGCGPDDDIIQLA